MVADLALPVDVGVVVARSEVAEPGFGIGEQVAHRPSRSSSAEHGQEYY